MNEKALSRLFLKDTAFQELMQRRIFNVLLIASPYDAFMMEEDGRVEEQLYFEYVSLNLSSPPRVTRVSSSAEAVAAMRTAHFDLVITMPSMDISETFSGARDIKAVDPTIPVVVLTPFSKEVSRRLENEDFTHVDYVFSSTLSVCSSSPPENPWWTLFAAECALNFLANAASLTK